MRGSNGALELTPTSCVQRVYHHHLYGLPGPTKLTSPLPAFQMQQIKQEPMEEDRNDSGVNSESSFHSSSPGSENSQDFISNSYPLPSTHLPQQACYKQLVQTIPSQYPRFNLPASYQQNDHPTTEAKVPAENNKDVEETDNPLQRLQFSLEKKGLLPPSISPPSSEHSGDEDKKSDDGKDFDELGVHTPRINSHGKVKTFKCKYCTYVTVTKHDYWEHLKEHIKEDKRLNCHMCGFITEYKHHLEYHLRNHDGSKPFKCNKCSYSCVNKSMLSSHMKSHSNVYQYRCSDCSYATKYCHSLKLHLRKYDHSPAMVLNPDGTPNPLPIIDVYGTRRGPKQKSSLKCEKQEQQQPPWPNPLSHLMMNSMQLPFPYHLLAGLQNQNQFAQSEKQNENDDSIDDEEQQETEQAEEMSSTSENEKEAQVLDLSKNEASNTPQVPIKTNRRKGPAYKLENLRLNESSDEEDDGHATPTPTVEKVKAEEGINNNNNNDKSLSYCQYCNIRFGDIVMYTMHMGYHGYKDPFKCNMCGEQSNDRVSFFLHIVRNAHT